jgi:DMSO/TMAO reductase YedYZ molybdopterin-dependent catalytic subunit
MNEIPKIISPDTRRSNRIPPGQHLVTDWPVLHYGGVPRLNLGQWTFNVGGLVERPARFDYQQFAALPRVQVFSDIHCVTSWSRLDNLWEGVSAQKIAEMVKPRPEARFVIVSAAPNFTTNLPIEDFLEEDVLFAWQHDSQELSPAHGGPVRLVVPRLYFWKSAKWVTGLEFTAEDQPGFWESNGYHNHGDPWLEERYG